MVADPGGDRAPAGRLVAQIHDPERKVRTVLESDMTHQTAERSQDRRVGTVRRISLGMTIGLLVQYGLGMIVTFYVTVPRQDQGGGLLTAIGRALANGPVALGMHAALGLLLILGAVNLVIRAAAARQRAAAWLSAVGLLAILGAAASGAGFVNSAADGASLAMALLTGVALLCYTIIIYLPGAAPGASSGS
jgi:hypothetical protein